MKRYRLFLDLNKEEAWLNEMAAQGFQLEGKDWLGFYNFSCSDRPASRVRVDFRPFNSNADFQDYKSLFEDSGWRHIAGSKTSGSQYYACMGEGQEIFSDSISKAGRYMRVSQMWLSLACAMLPIMVVLWTTGITNPEAILNPRQLYLTPGLWDLTGVRFWVAFLFETPFALMRGYSGLAIPALVGLYFIFALRARRLYRQTLAKE